MPQAPPSALTARVAALRVVREHLASLKSSVPNSDVAVDLHLVRADALAVVLQALRKDAARDPRARCAWAPSGGEG